MSSFDHSPEEHLPGDKSQKYDRQLRLWGDHGQAALEAAKICLINASATGTETLKNVILPGVGSFTIVDGSKVTAEDVGNNFFLEKDDIGKSRAQAATELLLELNEDVNGDYVDESVENLLDNNGRFFQTFNIIIATDVPERTLVRLAQVLWDDYIPLLVCRSYGFLGYMRLIIREHTVIELHPDNVLEDLRLDRPFPQLSAFCDSIHLETLSKKDHSHTPWLVILYKYLQQWKAEHAGEGPKNYREKNQLKECIRNGFRKNAEGVPEDEENFEEAIKNVNTALLPSRVDSEVEKIFQDDRCVNVHSESKPFWIMARAVSEFVKHEGEGLLPVRGSIPDMTSDSERYIQLQNVYKNRAAENAARVGDYVQKLLETLGRDEPLTYESRSPSSSPHKPQDNITDSDMRSFCKNANFLRVLRCRSLAQEYEPSSSRLPDIASRLDDTDDDDVVFYIMLRAVERFYSEFNRYPGCDQDTMEADIPKLKTCLCRLLLEYNITQSIKDEFVHEFCRYGASELHSVAAFIGGAAAQEVIKVVTGQFLPFNNTYIYNAMKQTSTTIEL